MNSRARYEPAALPGSVYIDTSYLANLSCFLGSFASVLCASVSRSVCSAGSFCRFCPRPDSVRPGRNGERERSSIKWDTENVTSARKGENGNNKKKGGKKNYCPLRTRVSDSGFTAIYDPAVTFYEPTGERRRAGDSRRN